MVVLSQQKRSWKIWSDLHNITVKILHALTIKHGMSRLVLGLGLWLWLQGYV